MAIRVKVLYFGQTKDAAGTGSEFLSLPDASSVRTLLRESTMAHRHLGEMSSSVRIAVNEEVVEEGRRLEDGDVIAFLPPVAGG